jgi:hypothetical protein
MRPMINLLLRLYPARWRARYGDEFAAVLEERPLGPFDVADVLLGALDAHLHLRGLGAASQHAKGFAMSLRIGGYAAVLGGILWLAGAAATSFDDTDTAIWPWAVFAAGTLALLVALAGLSAFQSRRYPRLIWVAFAVPAIGAVLSVLGLVATFLAVPGTLLANLTPWEVWFLGLILLVAGSGLFGIAGLRAGGVSRAGSGLLLVAGLTVIPMLVGVTGLVAWEPVISVMGMVLMFAFVGGWIVTGISAIRTDRPVLAPVGGMS